jgi:phosphoribosylpyrophosphate synthetase
MLHEFFEAAAMLKMMSEMIVYVNVTHEFFEAAMLKKLSEMIVYVSC